MCVCMCLHSVLNWEKIVKKKIPNCNQNRLGIIIIFCLINPNVVPNVDKEGYELNKRNWI